MINLEYFEENYGTEFGHFDFYYFKVPTLHNKRIFVYALGLNKNRDPLVRVQFGCLYGILSFGTECDCYFQWKESLKKIQAYGCGVAILLVDDDGRGIGFDNKTHFLKLQNKLNKPPIQTANELNIKYEDFSILKSIPSILNYLKIKKPIILLSNSPQKIKYLSNEGILIRKTTSIHTNENNLEERALRELDEKKRLLGHT